MREKRQVLVDKHDETRRNADTLNIGGGISLWPDMEDMRLSRAEFILDMSSVGFIGCLHLHHL